MRCAWVPHLLNLRCPAGSWSHVSLGRRRFPLHLGYGGGGGRSSAGLRRAGIRKRIFTESTTGLCDTRGVVR